MFYIDDNLKLIIEYKDNIKSIFDYENLEIGNIYRGRVDKVIPSMNSAFVNIGKEENGYLSLNDVRGKIKETEELLFQVKKVPPENKALRLTRELSITGRYIIMFLEKDILKFSNKLSKDDINRLKSLGLKGVLFRTSSKDVDDEKIIEEYNYLNQIKKNILLEKDLRPTPKLIYKRDNFLDYLLENAMNEEIIVNNKTIYKNLRDKFNINYNEDFSLIYNFELLEDYKSLFNRVVKLNNGGEIVIDNVESLTAIDVNTSSFVGDLNFEDTIYENNIIAAKEIIRQIILRNISGIIIIDFVDMKDKKHRIDLMNILKEGFKDDFTKTIVHGYTKLGLMEISRKNIGEELKNKIL